MSTLRLAYDKRVTKSAFMTKLCNDFGMENLSQCAHSERNYSDKVGHEVTVNMSLFYVDGTKHIGTWMKGKGWIFATAYNTVTA